MRFGAMTLVCLLAALSLMTVRREITHRALFPIEWSWRHQLEWFLWWSFGTCAFLMLMLSL
jgi:hypothetical protein